MLGFHVGIVAHTKLFLARQIPALNEYLVELFATPWLQPFAAYSAD
jgi:hypothetical protein